MPNAFPTHRTEETEEIGEQMVCGDALGGQERVTKEFCSVWPAKSEFQPCGKRFHDYPKVGMARGLLITGNEAPDSILNHELEVMVRKRV